MLRSLLRLCVGRFTCVSHTPCLGLNIRGGREYQLGIYVSKLDPGSLAEQGGVKMGDQILSANGVSFQNIDHYKAVEVMKSQAHVILTIKEAGRFPAYKELVTEFSWTEKSGRSASHSSASSLSSGTPLGSLSGLSQATLPVSSPLGAKMAAAAAQFPPECSDNEPLRTLSRGATELLQDSLIRSPGDEDGALSRPPVLRTRSHVTASEEEKRRKRESTGGGGEGSVRLQRPSTSFTLFPKRDSSSSPSHSESILGRNEGELWDALDVLRGTAERLLEEDDVAELMGVCETYLTERGLQTLVPPLLSVLNTPEKLLLLRDIRSLVSSADLPLFNSSVSPFEQEAYDVLKSRSHGSEQDVERRDQLRRFQPQTSSPFLDVPDNVSDSSSSCGTSALLPNWLLAEDTRSRTADAAVRDGDGADVQFPAVHMPRHKRPLLSQLFVSLRKSQVSPAGASVQPERNHTHDQPEFELTTVHISKTLQSLGISISGGSESRVQPMVKIERIFPGGAASRSEALRAGFELVSVDGVSLQAVTHQDAVHIIRQAFSNKSINPMQLVVRVPRVS